MELRERKRRGRLRSRYEDAIATKMELLHPLVMNVPSITTIQSSCVEGGSKVNAQPLK
jgi:hypothetical protein